MLDMKNNLCKLGNQQVFELSKFLSQYPLAQCGDFYFSSCHFSFNYLCLQSLEKTYGQLKEILGSIFKQYLCLIEGFIQSIVKRIGLNGYSMVLNNIRSLVDYL